MLSIELSKKIEHIFVSGIVLQSAASQKGEWTMSRFSEKVKHARLELGLTQPELGAAVGVSLRTILAYEKGEKEPRAGTLLKLAKALKVSSRFLKDDDCDDPMEEIEKDSYIMDARRQYGTRGEKQIRELMNDSVALMAGGEISEEEKEKFFNALMTAFVKSKEAAKETYGRKKGK